MKNRSIKSSAKGLADLIASEILQVIEKQGNAKKADKIVALAQEFLVKKTGHHVVFIETARRVNVTPLQEFFEKQGHVVEKRINPRLIAGVRVIMGNGQQIDFSFKSRLDAIFHEQRNY